MPQEEPLPDSVSKVFTYLANLLDSSIALRGQDKTPSIPEYLGIPDSRVIVTNLTLTATRLTFARRAFAALLREKEPDHLYGKYGAGPTYGRVSWLDNHEVVPVEAWASFPAGSVLSVLCVINLKDSSVIEPGGVYVHVAADHLDEAETFLEEFLQTSETQYNHYRGKTLVASVGDDNEIAFRVVKDTTDRREDIVVPTSTWEELDRNVVGAFTRRDDLIKAGLGANRGVLLYGPPGTGKTALCRVMAAEVSTDPDTTVIYAPAQSVARRLNDLYREAARFGPTLVVLEDIDLVAANRKSGTGSYLLDFLTALDGATTNQDASIVTLATTNDIKVMDPASVRAGRFDRRVEVHPPAEAERREILNHYLSLVATSDDVSVKCLQDIVASTKEATGADIRELVRRALLYSDGVVSASHLRDAAAELGYTVTSTGQYL